MGYLVTINTNGIERYIHIQKIEKIVPTKNSLLDGIKKPDGTDSIIPTKDIPPEEKHF